MSVSNLAGLVLAAAGVAASPFASAALLTYNSSYNSLTDVTNQAISIGQFDGSLGTLNSATFTLGAAMATQLTVVFDASAFVGWDKNIYSLSLVGDSGYNSVAINASLGPSRVVGTGSAGSAFVPFGAGANTLTVVGPNPSTFVQTGPALNPTQTFTLNSGLSPFIGTGALLFFLTTQNDDTVYAAGLQSGGLPANAGTSMLTTIAADIGVVYDYTPSAVPLPAAGWLLVAGLGALFPALRRRSQPTA